MPFVTVHTARGLLDEARKKELQVRLTDLLVEVEGGGRPDLRPYVWVLIEEHDPESWCLGGVQVDRDLLAQLQSS